MADLNVDELVEFGIAFRDLGHAIGDQVKEALEGDMECNPNAIREAMRALGGFDPELREELQDWLDRYERECEDEEAA